jgi:hypothetical protein
LSPEYNEFQPKDHENRWELANESDPEEAVNAQSIYQYIDQTGMTNQVQLSWS